MTTLPAIDTFALQIAQLKMEQEKWARGVTCLAQHDGVEAARLGRVLQEAQRILGQMEEALQWLSLPVIEERERATAGLERANQRLRRAIEQVEAVVAGREAIGRRV